MGGSLWEELEPEVKGGKKKTKREREKVGEEEEEKEKEQKTRKMTAPGFKGRTALKKS
jgi:hypothetical protein